MFIFLPSAQPLQPLSALESQEMSESDMEPEEPELSTMNDMPTFLTPTKALETLEAESSAENVQPSTSKSPKSKQAKEAELTLQLLEAEKPNEEISRKQHEALEISMNAQEILSPEKFAQFCRIVISDNLTNQEKFMELHGICAGKMELQDMLLDLLTAGEAHEISKDIYAQFCLRDSIKKFFRKIKMNFGNQSKILKDFQILLSEKDVKNEDLINFGTKYFKNSQLQNGSNLFDEFMTFITDVPYPEGLLPEPESIGNVILCIHNYSRILRSRFITLPLYYAPA